MEKASAARAEGKTKQEKGASGGTWRKRKSGNMAVTRTPQIHQQKMAKRTAHRLQEK
jgi:hypothetical protein